jgi:hypothetical protein
MQATGQVVVIGEQIGLGAGHLGRCLHARLSREPTAAARRQKIDFDAQAVLDWFTLDRRESCALRSRYRPYPQALEILGGTSRSEAGLRDGKPLRQ